MKNIVFFGDSYCGYIENVNNLSNPPDHRGFSPKGSECWPSIVANSLKRNIIHHGYCGTGWFFQYVNFMKWKKNNPDEWKNTDMMVFCFTNSNRIKSSNLEDINLFHEGKLDICSRCWTDNLFDRWSYEKIIDEAIKWFEGKKVVVFFNFFDEFWIKERLKNIISVCDTPLFAITRSEVGKQALKKHIPNHYNHFNSHNNKVLANIVIEKLTNYQIGSFSINEELFDIPYKEEGIDEWLDFQKNNIDIVKFSID